MLKRFVNSSDFWGRYDLTILEQKKAAEKKEKETKKTIVQCDDLLTFRQFSKKAADDVIDVRNSLFVAK